MLRAMITDTPFEQRWVLQGRLCNKWAADLKERWESTRRTRIGRKCTVDLEDVISLDTQGEAVLLEMAAEGAALSATRAYMKYILESLHLRRIRRGETSSQLLGRYACGLPGEFPCGLFALHWIVPIRSLFWLC
jgi:anti-anti-sigma regulatory factor